MNIDLYLGLRWTDHRLDHRNSTHQIVDRNKTITFTGDACDQIWRPDLYFYNARTTKRSTVTQTNKQLYVYTDGYVMYGQR